MKSKIEIARLAAGLSIALAQNLKTPVVNDEVQRDMVKLLDVMMYVLDLSSAFSNGAEALKLKTEAPSDAEVYEMLGNISREMKFANDAFLNKGQSVVKEYIKEAKEKARKGEQMMPFSEYYKLNKRGDSPVGGDADPSLN